MADSVEKKLRAEIESLMAAGNFKEASELRKLYEFRKGDSAESSIEGMSSGTNRSGIAPIQGVATRQPTAQQQLAQRKNMHESRLIQQARRTGMENAMIPSCHDAGCASILSQAGHIAGGANYDLYKAATGQKKIKPKLDYMNYAAEALNIEHDESDRVNWMGAAGGADRVAAYGNNTTDPHTTARMHGLTQGGQYTQAPRTQQVQRIGGAPRPSHRLPDGRYPSLLD